MLKRRLSEISQSNEGSTIIEYAIVVPIFLLLVMMIVEYSIIMYSQSVLTGAMIDAARQAKTTYNPGSTTDAGDPSLTGVCVPPAHTSQSDLQYIQCVVAYRVGGLLNPALLNVTDTSYSGGNFNIAAGNVDLYTVTYPWTVSAPFIQYLLPNVVNGQITLSASVLIKTEDTSATTIPILSQ